MARLGPALRSSLRRGLVQRGRAGCGSLPARCGSRCQRGPARRGSARPRRVRLGSTARLGAARHSAVWHGRAHGGFGAPRCGTAARRGSLPARCGSRCQLGPTRRGTARPRRVRLDSTARHGPAPHAMARPSTARPGTGGLTADSVRPGAAQPPGAARFLRGAARGASAARHGAARRHGGPWRGSARHGAARSATRRLAAARRRAAARGAFQRVWSNPHGQPAETRSGRLTLPHCARRPSRTIRPPQDPSLRIR